MYEIYYKPLALKALLKMPKNQALLIRNKINALKADPYVKNSNVKKLQGIEGYRLRVGDWRIIYHVDHKVLKILVIKIASRGGVYK
ncbi:MAG: type II toxin-antitoxin system RelE/ParE family toxin [Proteobacteria bacterium]|nr:type II toxin-antitoxin system RelE/ParE family toxin [Pseudomonadota bacterium]